MHPCAIVIVLTIYYIVASLLSLLKAVELLLMLVGVVLIRG